MIELGAVVPLMRLLKDNHAETRGFAAACLSCLCREEEARVLISEAGGADTLLALAHGPATWLRGQAIEMLSLLGIPVGDPDDYDASASPPLYGAPRPYGAPTPPLNVGDAAERRRVRRAAPLGSPTSSPAITRRSTPMTSGANTARTHATSASGSSSNGQTFGTKMKFHFFSFQVNRDELPGLFVRRIS